VASNPELASQVLHSPHTVVHSYSDMWEEEMHLVVHDLKRDERVRTKGLVIMKRLQLMLYSTMSSTQNQMSSDLCEGGRG
jgi:hypothetical protein